MKTSLLIALLAFGPSLLSPNAAASSATSESGSLFFEWLDPISLTVQRANMAPCVVSRNLAIMHVAAFDAINAADGRYEAYAYRERPDGAIDAQVAGVVALRDCANALFTSDRARFAAVSERQLDQLRSSLAAEVFERSVAVGAASARANLQAREGDGSTSDRTYIPKRAVGKWSRTPPRFRPPELSYWGRTQPFVIGSVESFRLPPPPSLDSPEYAAAVLEVKRLGGKESDARTAEQTEIARFWSCFSYTSTPAGHWYEIAMKIARQEELNLLESSRLLALINLAMVDAGIACWDAKYRYESWRPIQAIRGADKDGNAATEADPAWDSLLESPPHPEYVSGHASFSGAGARIMELFFDKGDGFPFETTSSSLRGTVRSYQNFSECSEEICMSRVYGGIHFRFSNERGRELGEKVAQHVWENALRRVPSPALTAVAR